ncbi:type II secretion system minor pseudopilin GspK [Hyphococcus flavus]|uniref:Type II secretion system protein K n=1 Tax=Hyphococcus flavus TaxID=1866326 RepID=A0AAF0CFA4_9PROT|nr:type II secretion system minor pseudopilin GspK [Hyphococcus flavus]WDI31244.1 type II secretion system minor pseudopilin GspK [Hyphococcus flavus]
MIDRKQQKGAALLIVLLLVATLSFVALASLEHTSLASVRAANVQARGEAIWRGFAAEALARSAIERAYAANSGKLSLDDPWATQPLEIPFDDGGVRIFFADASLCYNVNSLASLPPVVPSDQPPQELAEFIRLAVNLGINEFEAMALADAITDWVDEDSNRRPQGAEDEYYTTLPSPYRTGNRFMASVTELRAVKGFTRNLYATLKPYLCARNDSVSGPMNINMATERHAPLLAAVFGDGVAVQLAREIIASRPVGGYETAEAFLASPQVKALQSGEQAGERFDVRSAYLQARAEIVYDTALVEITTDFAIGDNGETSVIARRIGAEE